MLTDSLLDFLHLYSSPAILFNVTGELLFANPAAQLCEGTKLSTVAQLQTAIFRAGPVIPLQVQTTFNQHRTQQQSKQSHEEEEEEYDFSFSANNNTNSRSSFDSTTSSSSSSSSSSASTAVASLSPPPTARPSSYQKSSRPSSSLSSSSSKSNQVLDRSRLNGRFPVSKAANGGDEDDGSIPGSNHDSSRQGCEDMSTPIGQIKESTITWKITRTKCKRVVALAQDMPSSSSSSQGTIPIMSENETNLQRDIVPIIQGSWESQSRFESMKRGGGIMGETIRKFDWQNHPLGPIASWPQARVEMVGLMLRSPVPMTAYLEHEGFCLYNDAYIAVLGQTKHTSGVLGKPAREVWGEIWEYIEIPLQDAMNGIAIERHDQLLFFERLQDGGPVNRHEEVHATWYYIPYWGPDRVIGNLHMLFESHHAISSRRFNTINNLSANLLSSRSTIDLCRNALEVLSVLDADLPYCLAYTAVDYQPPEMLATPDNAFETGSSGAGRSNNRQHITISSSASSYSTNDLENQSNIFIFALQETVGCSFDSNIAPSRIMVDTDDDEVLTPLATEGSEGLMSSAPTQLAWQSAMLEMVKTGNIVEVTNVQDWLVDVPHRGLPGMLAYRGVVIPLKQGEKIVACIALALNPALPWSDEFKTFINILSRQMNLSLSMVQTYEQEVQRAEELAALDRAKTSFFTSISHELRTPLTLILGPVKDLLADASLTRAQASSISLVYRNARRLLRLVNSILDFARAEAGKLSSQFSPMQLGVITSELASSFRSAVESVGIDYIVENRTPDDVIVWADVDFCKEKICFNLISNALKFTTSGQIRVISSSDNYHFYLEVQDSGVGIPANELSSIFERFVRVENTQARSIEGSGIGLSLTLELVKAHGGKIGVESIFQRGTTFKVKIPLGNEHLPKQYLVNPNAPSAIPKITNGSEDYHLHSADSAFGGTGTKSESNTDESPETASRVNSDLWRPLIFGERQRARILLADDNADLRMFIKSILSKYADVSEATDGEVAWKMLRSDQYDLVLSDIMMPRMNGFQLLANIRSSEKHKSMPVILLSARAGEDAGVESLSSGADDHLSKPFSSKELILRVHSHLQLATIRSELEVRVSERTAALEESRETFKKLSELLQVGVHRSDRSGSITWANKKWFQVLGLEEGSWNGWESRIHPDDRDMAATKYLQTVESGQGYEHPVEMRLVQPDGTVIDITYELQAERSSFGDCTGFVGVFSDVSSLRKLERDRIALERQRREEAEQNRQLQEHFIDVTCHELRNPLNAISNSAELLAESLNRFVSRQTEWKKDPILAQALSTLEADMQEDLEAVETILLSSRHQKRIADDVLHISKISGNLVQLVQKEWKPEDCLRSVLKMFNLEMMNKSIQSSLHVDPSLHYFGESVIGDEGRFAQVCVNLLANAIKFLDTSAVKHLKLAVGATPVLPEATLRSLYATERFSMDQLLPLCAEYATASGWGEHVNANEALLHFSIHDTGPGMSEEEQSRIFLRFAQASPKTFGEFGGFGLGLWISKRLVELHGGAVALQSIEGVGTVFRLYIKVQKVVAPLLVVPSSVPSLAALAGVGSTLDPQASDFNEVTKTKVTGRNPLILVVEDNDVNLKVLARLLKTLKCDVLTSTDGSECIAKIDELRKTKPYPPIDLIFMDLEMPIMDGLTATRNIRASEADGTYAGARVPIVAVSANARQVYADLSAQAGIDHFLRKPYNAAQLREILGRFIERD